MRARAELAVAVGEARATDSVGVLVEAAETATMLRAGAAEQGSRDRETLGLCTRARARLELARDRWETARWGPVPHRAAPAVGEPIRADGLADLVRARLALP